MKYYAVKKGRKTGIFSTWDACKASVHGYPGAIYKSFASMEDAKAFISGSEGKKKVKKPSSVTNDAVAYVDGSYNRSTKTYGSGVVFFMNGTQENIKKAGTDPEMEEMWNVAGEVVAAMIAMERAKELGAKKLTIYHDYNGIAGWVVGSENGSYRTKVWNAEKAGAIRYKGFVEKMLKDMKIEFVKVKAHSGDQYNELADKLAKQACGV